MDSGRAFNQDTVITHNCFEYIWKPNSQSWRFTTSSHSTKLFTWFWLLHYLIAHLGESPHPTITLSQWPWLPDRKLWWQKDLNIDNLLSWYLARQPCWGAFFCLCKQVVGKWKVAVTKRGEEERDVIKEVWGRAGQWLLMTGLKMAEFRQDGLRQGIGEREQVYSASCQLWCSLHFAGGSCRVSFAA